MSEFLSKKGRALTLTNAEIAVMKAALHQLIKSRKNPTKLGAVYFLKMEAEKLLERVEKL